MKIGIVVLGAAETASRFSKRAARSKTVFKKAAKKAAQIVLADAVSLAPIDTGALRASGRITEVAGGETPLFDIQFGGDKAPYAVFVHEDLTVQHKTGQAKFLETALQMNAKRVKKIIGDGLAELYQA